MIIPPFETFGAFGKKEDRETEVRDPKKIADEIIALQREVGRDVIPSDHEKLAELIEKDLVLFVKNGEGEIVASANMEPVAENAYLLGGACSKSKLTRLPLAKEMLDRFGGSVIYAKTHEKIGAYLTPLGFKKYSLEDFKTAYPDLYRAHLKSRKIDETRYAPKAGTYFFIRMPAQRGLHSFFIKR